MITDGYRYTLESELNTHGWDNHKWDEAAGVFHMASSLHAGHMCLDLDGGMWKFMAEDPATADMLEVLFDTPPGMAYTCGMESLKDTLIAMAEAMLAPSPTLTPSLETEVEATVKQRRYQQRYRERQLALWDNRCALTGCALPALLVASHAKPWAVSSPRERLDPYNGFLLEKRFDVLFDKGFISFTDEGDIILSPRLSPELCQQLHLTPDLHLRLRPSPQHLPYLRYHREHIYS